MDQKHKYIARPYTLTLTVQVSAEEKPDEFDHTWLQDVLAALFPQSQETLLSGGRTITARVIHQQINRNY